MKNLFGKLVRANDFIYWFIVFVILSAEAIFTFVSIPVGVIIYLTLLISLLVIALMKHQEPNYPLFTALTLIPLFRIISISLPMTGLPELFGIIVVSVPLFLTGIMISKTVSLTPKAMGFKISKLYQQLLIALSGLPLGMIRFYIIRPESNRISVAPIEIIVWAATLLGVGLLEEFLFRGVLFHVANQFLGNNKAMFFISLLYATLAISSKSLFNIIFAFLLSILFCRIIIWKESIVGISLAHGLMNITFYLICPQILSNSIL